MPVGRIQGQAQPGLRPKFRLQKKNAPDPAQEQSPNARPPPRRRFVDCNLPRACSWAEANSTRSRNILATPAQEGSCCGDEHRHGPGPLTARTCETVRVPLGVGPARAGRAWALARARTTAGAGVRLKRATEPGPRLRLDLISQTNASVPSRQMDQLPVRVV